MINRNCHGDDKEDISPTFWETQWRKRDKLIAFTFFCLACRYDDVVANVEEGGWAYLSVRVQELLTVSIIAFCTSVVMNKRYGDCSTEPIQTAFNNSLLASESDTTIDMLSERDVETQTENRNYAKETSGLKTHHRREMRRLKRQKLGIKRHLASQWREANQFLKSRNQLLSELHDKLVPLEKEIADHLLEKEIIENQLEEERRRHVDLMERIDRVYQQLEAVGACANCSQLNDNNEAECLLGPEKEPRNISNMVVDKKVEGYGLADLMSVNYRTEMIEALHADNRTLQAGRDKYANNHVNTRRSTNLSSDLNTPTDPSSMLSKTYIDVPRGADIPTSESAALAGESIDTLNDAGTQQPTVQGTSPTHNNKNEETLLKTSLNAEGAAGTNMAEGETEIHTTIAGLEDDDGHAENSESGFQTVSRTNRRHRRKAKAAMNRQSSNHELAPANLATVSYRNIHDTSQRHSQNQDGPQQFNRNTIMNGNQPFNNSVGQYYQDSGWNPPFMPRNEYERQNFMRMQMNHVVQHDQARQLFNSINGGSGWYNRYRGMIGRGNRGRS